MKKIVVIGGGIAGLSAGAYAQKCGFDVTVLESHSVAGGNCAAWRRGGYLFEGGMHWLTGSGEGEALHGCWRHVGALGDGVAVRYDEPFAEYFGEGAPARIYRDADETEARLLELSPADAKEIKNLCANIRKVKSLGMVVSDLRGLRVTKKRRAPPPSALLSFLSAAGVMRVFSKISAKEYASRFSHEGIREALGSLTGEGQSALALVFTLGALARGDGGFPEGGSLPFVKRIVNTFEAAGGKLELNARAERVVVERGRATGAVVAGSFVPADAVIVATDTMAIDSLFDDPPKAAWLDRMRMETEPTACALVSLGISADLSKYPAGFVFKPGRPIRMGSETYNYLSANNYARDPSYSPAGKTAMTLILPGDTHDFWKSAKSEGRYAQEKRALADAVAGAIEERIPEARGRVEVRDVATPLTYERYCGNWKGSWMTRMRPGMRMRVYPPAIKGLGGAYFAGQRMMPPGGLPVALLSARAAVQRLCRDSGATFASEEY